jgi:N-acetylneuraminate synthase
MEQPIVVAEVGCNHCGSLDIAQEMIKIAAFFCKADYIKFQKRCPTELLPIESYNSPHPNPANSYGDTYGLHREYLELNIKQHFQLYEWCQQYGIKYACSVWDMTSAKEIISLSPDFIKIPSASNTNLDMLKMICEEFGGHIHVSTGMTTRNEMVELIALLESKGRLKDTVIYKCTSGYPVAFSECYLLEIVDFVRDYGSRVAGIGFSGHHLGLAIDNAAFALGARWIERHYTLDRTWKGTDHAASLEPDGLRRLCRDLKATAEALRQKPSEILSIEVPQREKLKWVRK